MKAIITTLSELAWGVTAGGLNAAATTFGQIALVGFGVAGCAYVLWRRRRNRKRSPILLLVD